MTVGETNRLVYPGGSHPGNYSSETRPDLVGPETATELAKLREDTAPDAPEVVRAGAVFVDNSSAYRMDDDVPPDADADDVRFGDLKPGYATQFATFSAERLFTVLDAYAIDVRFYLPGTTTPAIVRG